MTSFPSGLFFPSYSSFATYTVFIHSLTTIYQHPAAAASSTRRITLLDALPGILTRDSHWPDAPNKPRACLAPWTPQLPAQHNPQVAARAVLRVAQTVPVLFCPVLSCLFAESVPEPASLLFSPAALPAPSLFLASCWSWPLPSPPGWLLLPPPKGLPATSCELPAPLPARILAQPR